MSEDAIAVSEDVLDSVPTQKLLKRLVVPRIAYMWHDIGVQLGMSISHLTIIDENYNPVPDDECCKEMLKLWKRKGIEVSGAKLIEAIENNKNASYAAELRAEIKKHGEAATVLNDYYTQKHIVPKIATEWDSIALDLGINDFEIRIIRQIPDPAKNRCTEMLLLWMKRSTTITWRNIFDAMQCLDLKKAAEDLKNDLSLLNEVDKQDLNQKYLRYLSEAKKNSKVVKFKHMKILLSGSSAAGKSSFCCLLFGQKFSNVYNSTDVMETKQGIPVTNKNPVAVQSFSLLKQGDKVMWLELDPENQLRHFKSLLSHMFSQHSSASSEPVQDQKYSSSPNTQQHEEYSSVVSGGAPGDHMHKEYTAVEQKIIKSSALPDDFELDDTVKLITVIDSGGQPEYITLLPAINSIPTINFVVHNLTKKLEDPVLVRYKKGQEEAPEYLLDYSNFDMIQLLMCFITDSLEHPTEETPLCISTPGKPRVGFVGTHCDLVKDSAALQEVNHQLNNVITERQCKYDVLPPKRDDDKIVIFQVDNTTSGDAATECSAVKRIREHVVGITEEMESKELPITWMIIELKIQVLRTDKKKKYIMYEEYKEIAKEDAWITDEEEVKASLKYFHFLGIVLCFNITELCDWVIIDLQWLFTHLAKIMHLSSKSVKTSEQSLIKRFNKQRLLAKKLLKSVKLADISDSEIQYFINTLVHLKVITTITIEQCEYYYLPCALPSTMQYSDNCRFLLSEPLLIQFTSGYLPRGFFCSLVAHLLKKMPENWKHQLGVTSTKHFSNVMTICLPDETFLRLHDKTYYLELQVRHYNKDVGISYHSKILPVLRKFFEVVCQQLHFDYAKLKFGFLCHAGYDSNDHMVVVGSIDGNKILKERTLLKCTRDPSHTTQIGESHNVWFDKRAAAAGSLQCDDHRATQHAANYSSSADDSTDESATIERGSKRRRSQLAGAKKKKLDSATKSVVKGAVIIDQIKNKDDTPTMRDLNRYVTKKHATMWKDVGLELKLERGLLVTMQKDNPQDTVNCFEEVLDKWLKLTPSATWKELEIALTNANRMQLGHNPVEDLYVETMN